MIAAYDQDADLAKFLLSKADVDGTVTITKEMKPQIRVGASAGDTVLHIAEGRRQYGWLIPILSKLGAKVNGKNALGRTPMDAALAYNIYSNLGSPSIDMTKSLRALRDIGGVSTYPVTQIRDKAASAMMSDFYVDPLRAQDFAHSHGLTVRTKTCSTSRDGVTARDAGNGAINFGQRTKD